MANFCGVLQFQYEVLDVDDIEQAEGVINNALDRLGDLSLDRFNWDGIDWSIRECEEENE